MRAWLERSFRNRIFLTVLLVALVPLLLCDVLVTQVDAAAEGADAFFPNLDAAPDWTVETVGEWQEENGLRFRYVDYVRRT